MKDPIYLSPTANYQLFFKSVKINDVVQYSLLYNFPQIESMVEECGVSIKHLSSNTKECKSFGICLFRVVEKYGLESDLKPLEPVMFDPKMLDL